MTGTGQDGAIHNTAAIIMCLIAPFFHVGYIAGPVILPGSGV